jgi:NitT/TauT family transport system substrate-binding protein
MHRTEHYSTEEMIFLKTTVGRGALRPSPGAKMRFPRIRTSSVLLATTAVALAAGCTSGSSSGTATTTVHLEKTNITVAAVPAIDSAGLYIAQQDGFFRDQGLTVKIAPPITSSETAIATQLKGGYDVTAGAYPSYIEADAAGSPMDIIAEGSVVIPNGQEIIVPPGSKITSLAGLEGKTVAVNAPRNIGSLLVDSVLVEHHISPASVKIVYIPFPAMGTALNVKHTVDAAFVPEPFISLYGQEYGDQELVNLAQGATSNFPIEGYAVTRRWAARYPNTLAAFLRALKQGQQVADTDQGALQTAMVKFADVPPTTAAIMGLASFPLTLDPVRLQRVANVMEQFGVLRLGKPFRIQSMLLP